MHAYKIIYILYILIDILIDIKDLKNEFFQK